MVEVPDKHSRRMTRKPEAVLNCCQQTLALIQLFGWIYVVSKWPNTGNPEIWGMEGERDGPPRVTVREADYSAE